MGNYNQDAWRLVENKVKESVTGGIKESICAGKGDSLPSAADYIGQLFVRTGATDPGLYVATGTTTPGWKTVTHAS